jgi:thiamine biosynthesis protein ThiI
MQNQVIFVNYGELWLRKGNKNKYINQLKHNLASLLQGESFSYINEHDRIILKPSNQESENKIIDKLGYLFGISKFGIAYRVEPKLQSIANASKELLSNSKYKKIKINAHRAFKGFNFNSIDIIREVSKKAKEIGIEPSLHEFDGELFISVTKDNAYLYSYYKKGLGGLPVGTAGKAVILLSGGIDSPVAAWFAMKRGVVPIFLHAYQYSSIDPVLESKIPKIVEKLSLYAKGFKLKTYYIPAYYFTLTAAKIDRLGKYEPVLFKAFLLRVAERIAKKEKANLIFTGESLGQVSSQTPANIRASQEGIKLPVLRPLIGFDKEEIIDIAKKIDTYNLSIIPYPDVCSINAKDPSTAVKHEIVKKMLKDMGISKIVKETLKESLEK